MASSLFLFVLTFGQVNAMAWSFDGISRTVREQGCPIRECGISNAHSFPRQRNLAHVTKLEQNQKGSRRQPQIFVRHKGGAVEEHCNLRYVEIGLCLLLKPKL